MNISPVYSTCTHLTCRVKLTQYIHDVTVLFPTMKQFGVSWCFITPYNLHSPKHISIYCCPTLSYSLCQYPVVLYELGLPLAIMLLPLADLDQVSFPLWSHLYSLCMYLQYPDVLYEGLPLAIMLLPLAYQISSPRLHPQGVKWSVLSVCLSRKYSYPLQVDNLTTPIVYNFFSLGVNFWKQPYLNMCTC